MNEKYRADFLWSRKDCWTRSTASFKTAQAVYSYFSGKTPCQRNAARPQNYSQLSRNTQFTRKIISIDDNHTNRHENAETLLSSSELPLELVLKAGEETEKKSKNPAEEPEATKVEVEEETFYIRQQRFNVLLWPRAQHSFMLPRAALRKAGEFKFARFASRAEGPLAKSISASKACRSLCSGSQPKLSLGGRFAAPARGPIVSPLLSPRAKCYFVPISVF